MPDAFTLLWAQHTCRALREHGRVGEQPPVASGNHQSLPAWTGAQPGDEVYALRVHRHIVHVVSRMRIVDLHRGECCGPAPVHWQDSACPGHEDWEVSEGVVPEKGLRPVPFVTARAWAGRRGSRCRCRRGFHTSLCGASVGQPNPTGRGWRCGAVPAAAPAARTRSYKWWYRPVRRYPDR